MNEIIEDPNGDSEVLTIIADYSTSLKELREKGEYDVVDPRIKNVVFRVSGKDGKFKLPVNIIHTETPAVTENLASKLQAKGLRHASVEEILTFGFTFPEMQRQFIILALNAVCSIGKDKYVLFLHGDEKKRSLNLCPMKEKWSEACRFLVFDLDHNQDSKLLPAFRR